MLRIWSVFFFTEHIDCHKKLQTIMDGIRLQDNEEELIQNATRDITQLCAGNVILWTQFLETATLDQGVIFYLAKEHHSARVTIITIDQYGVFRQKNLTVLNDMTMTGSIFEYHTMLELTWRF